MAMDTRGRSTPDLTVKIKEDAIAGVAHPDGYDVMPGETATVPPWLGLQLLSTGRADLVKEGAAGDVEHGDPSVTTQQPGARQRRTK